MPPPANFRHAKTLGSRRGTASGKKGQVSLRGIVTFLIVLIGSLYLMLALSLVKESNPKNKGIPALDSFVNDRSLIRAQPKFEHVPGLSKTYDYWRNLAVTLAALPPDKILNTLESQDPFGVRRFEERLLQAESDKGAFLDLEDLKNIFSCPEDRITHPDQRNLDRGIAFRNMTMNTFLFFQHLRKAGGTNFCTLAEHNLPKAQVPPYYCMPDFHWDGQGQKCAGCFSSWKNEDIINNMHSAGHRILGNEWDPFDPDRFFDLPAVYATSFRKPLDRALSQFRFECIEERGCKIKNVTIWWEKRKDLTNVYTWTFSKQGIRKMSVGNSPLDASRRQEALGKALDSIARFHLVMVMEWLAYAPKLVQDVLGFTDTSTMTERVRPHINQFQRNDGQEKNNMGALGITKASWSPKNYLSPEQYKIMSENLALDEVLTDAARRMFLERVVCEDP